MNSLTIMTGTISTVSKSSNNSSNGNNIWLSDLTHEIEKWKSTTTAMRRFFRERSERAPVPWLFNDWLEHRAYFFDDKAQRERRKLTRYVSDKLIRSLVKYTPTPPFASKSFLGNRSSVLAQQTIWCPNWSSTDRAGAEVWPPPAEFKYEGDGRAERNFGRMLPLPRRRLTADLAKTGDELLANSDLTRHLTRIEQYPLDNVDKVDRIRRDWLLAAEAAGQWEVAVEVHDSDAVRCLGHDMLNELE